jgi:hypothetical protein
MNLESRWVMGEILTVAKIGTGTSEDPIRPNTASVWWQVKCERETEFDIEVIDLEEELESSS